MSGFKGTKGPWLIERVNQGHGGCIIYNYIGNTGEKVITDSHPIKLGEPTVFSVITNDSFLHKGNFEDKENCTGYYNSSELPHKANAILISKAPEMLEMLEKIEHDLRHGYNIQSSIHTKIQQLIKSATEL